MKTKTLTALMVLTGASYAFAGGGAPVPEGTMKDAPSGRPGKVLNETECQKAWEMAGPDGDTLSKDKAVPFVLNFQMVDTSGDAKVSAEEWKTGCSKGWVSADAETAKDMEAAPAGDETSTDDETSADGGTPGDEATPADEGTPADEDGKDM